MRNVRSSCSPGDLADVLLRMLFGGVVDQDVQTAQLLHRLRDHFLADALVADVARQQQAFPAFLFDLALRFLRVLVFVEVTDGNVRAFFCEENCDGAANAAVPAGDQGDLAFQFA